VLIEKKIKLLFIERRNTPAKTTITTIASATAATTTTFSASRYG
jgi:hypothetical protein